MFDLLSHHRSSLVFQTELLESCDWDEDQMAEVLKTAAKVFENVEIPDIPCPLNFYLDKVLRPALFKEKLHENQVNTIIKFVQHDAKFIQWMMSAEEE